MAETTLRGISEIRAYFRTNPTPVYFVSPTAFNLLGIDRWLRNFFYVNYFDSFEGHHPRVFVPREKPYREFTSMEDVCNSRGSSCACWHPATTATTAPTWACS